MTNEARTGDKTMHGDSKKVVQPQDSTASDSAMAGGPRAGYVEADISDEAWREVDTARGTYRIDNPVTLIFRKGGSTHRVVDANGVVHCYVAPETGLSIIRWKAKDGKAAVRF